MFLARSGSLSVPKRELRFIIESSIKLCFIQQKNDRFSIADKLKQFDKTLKSPSISIKDDLKLWMLPAFAEDASDEELGRLYGKTSSYVHLTPSQIAQRIAAVDAGRTIGYENAADVDGLNALISKGFAASLILLFHSVREYVAGDFLVDPDGSTVISYFLGSRFIAEMLETARIWSFRHWLLLPVTWTLERDGKMQKLHPAGTRHSISKPGKPSA